MRVLRRHVPELALVAVSLFYGAAFLPEQWGVRDLTPFGFLAIRYVVAGVIAIPVALRMGWRTAGEPVSEPVASDRWRGLILAGLFVSVLASIGYLTQLAGLQYTTTSNSAFITGLYAVFVPVFEVAIYRKRPPASVLVAIVVAVVGLYFLTGAGGALNVGDALTLLTALAWGLWIALAGLLGRRYPIFGLTALMFIFSALTAIALGAVFGFGTITVLAVTWAAVLGLGSVTFDSLNLWAQTRVEPSRAGVIMLVEPLFAAMLGFVVGERLGPWGALGGVLMLLAIFLVEFRPGSADNPQVAEEPGLEVAD